MKDLGLLLLRITAGAILMAHGYPKLFGGPGKRPHPLLARGMGPNYPGAVERGGPGFVTALVSIVLPEFAVAPPLKSASAPKGAAACPPALICTPPAPAVEPPWQSPAVAARHRERHPSGLQTDVRRQRFRGSARLSPGVVA